jgi:aryl-alcohol dehydrogenase-like predicted oxidoreductase
MEYRPLGRTGVMVTPLCLGTMNFGLRTPEDEAVAIIGPRTMAHFEDNFGALEIQLTGDNIEQLEAASVPGGTLFPDRS